MKFCSKENYEKVMFRLEPDADGYPPDDWESLWGKKLENGKILIDNIPFFVCGVALGDTISVKRINDESFFDEKIDSGGHSTIRVIFLDRSKIEDVRKVATDLGCSSEKSHLENLIAIDVPIEVDYSRLVEYLDVGEGKGLWEYEEGCLRHS